MDNGCVCCTVRGDLVHALNTLANRKDKRFDAVIIETTGLADPAPARFSLLKREAFEARFARDTGGVNKQVAFTFMINPDIGDRFRIDSILCLVDCKHIKQHLDEARSWNVL